jgi:hypothetical protein
METTESNRALNAIRTGILDTKFASHVRKSNQRGRYVSRLGTDPFTGIGNTWRPWTGWWNKHPREPKIKAMAVRKNLDSVWIWFYKDVAPVAFF